MQIMLFMLIKKLPKVAVWATKLNLFTDPLGTRINQKTLHFSQFLGSMDGKWTISGHGHLVNDQ